MRQPFQLDAYQTQATAQVVSYQDQRLVLDSTLFYPRGGGQPGDIGWISAQGQRIEVVDTRYSDDRSRIEHHLAEAVDWAPGDRVELELNWDRRHRHMRMHTCLHLLCHLIKDPVTGGNVGAEQSRAEFDLTTPIDKAELEAQLNALIAQGAEVTTEWLPESILDEQPELVRTMSVQPPRGAGELRMVRVAGLDYQPCGGTHVKNIREIGQVRIPSIKSKGKQNKRINVELVN
ncbi:alanyl-tRNA editing protein [Saccharospirillum mangrovi]|uniref:alanyl-tRNA editing protein n=1 Tax=Saccharospirillum mangrovi TaxID=2161747 RepID=UPI000D3B397E|nr:alanyl-tRNA editing protein [Saccharospirillum mangrovi]